MDIKLEKENFVFRDDSRMGSKALVFGVILLLLSAIAIAFDSHQLFYSYLVSFIFWLSISLGALFFVMLHHLTNATWSIGLRRVSENLMMVLPMMIIMFIPLLFGLKQLYPWADPAIVGADHILQKRLPYLNIPFFIIRAVTYFAIWFILSRILFRTSLQQDAASAPGQIIKFRRTSAAGMVLFAISISFAAFDWLLSLDAHWYSTIFGVYVFSGSLLSGLASITLIMLFLQRKTVFARIITKEHYHDLGKLLFAFTIFWAYIAFSQYFLIWYANIPEETIWFAERWKGAWKYLSLIIIFGHFVVPFLVLITRPAKRSRPTLISMAALLLVVHWIDIYWIVMPNLHRESARFHWADFTILAGIGCLFIWQLLRRMTAAPIAPLNDPRLGDSINIVSD